MATKIQFISLERDLKTMYRNLLQECNRDKLFKAIPRYLPTIQYCLKPCVKTNIVLKSETLTVRSVMADVDHYFVRK